MEEEETKCRKLMKALEHLRWLVRPNFISNLSLGEALVLSQYTHSQKAIEIFGRCTPSGSYSTIKRTMDTLDKEANALPLNDVVIGKA